MAHDVFISYAAEDKQAAEAVRLALEDAGIKCWIAPRDVPLGANYEEAIIDAICASHLMILILSAHSNKSPHVKREIQNACLEDSPTQILPVRVDAVPLNKALRYYLSSLQWLDASAPPFADHVPELVSTVRARLSAQGKEKVESEGVRAAIEKFEAEAKPAGEKEAGSTGKEAASAPATGRGVGGVMRQKRLWVAVGAALVLAVGAAIFWARKSGDRDRPASQSPTPANLVGQSPTPAGQNNAPGASVTKLYKDMSESEQLEFVRQRAQPVLAQLGDDPQPLDDEALRRVRRWVNGYSRRVGNGSRAREQTDTRFIFAEARQHAPFIIKTFNDRGVPPVIGLYLPVVESEYKNLCTPRDQAKGIYQIYLATAAKYGLGPHDFCNVEKSVQVAAYYMSDLIKSWGRDEANVTLAIFSFNRNP
ncbi:MAG TPA: TIR domain-containing protein, partial [Pyrinomonadaceae bacterium]|nr:TIR domain-containing protein [Pyrinomonadaceae bacterium]